MDSKLAGRLDFTLSAPTQPTLPAGHHQLGLFAERDALLVVPEGIDPARPTPLVVLFHGGGGSAQKILPMLEAHAQQNGFLLLVPQSLYPTWDIVIAGNGPDRERLELALAEVASRFTIDPGHIAFAGHSDGGSYALSLGLTNGQFVTHLIISSAGFMSVQHQEGAPRVFISHGINDEQIPIGRSGRAHSDLLKRAGYDVTYVEYNGPHAYQPPVVALAVNFFLEDLYAPQGA
ncbi:alpha/beta hydrolase [Azorhizobium doebereinerae]|uniref:alpha/beta hydrolase n=1 Tax=Azorhizobium doebereinerae TaxID=281091 RepID=UPI00040BAA3F|nr:esterase [Azorhizobium doebereinerae]